MFKRKRKLLLDEDRAADFYRALADYNAAIAKLPPNWREIAEGKATLPLTWDEAKTALGDGVAGVSTN